MTDCSSYEQIKKFFFIISVLDRSSFGLDIALPSVPEPKKIRYRVPVLSDKSFFVGIKFIKRFRKVGAQVYIFFVSVSLQLDPDPKHCQKASDPKQAAKESLIRKVEDFLTAPVQHNVGQVGPAPVPQVRDAEHDQDERRRRGRTLPASQPGHLSSQP